MKKLSIFLFLISSFIKAQPSHYSFEISSSSKELNIVGMPPTYSAPLLKNQIRIIENGYSKINFLDYYFPDATISINNKTKEWRETSIYEETTIGGVYKPYPYIRYDNDFLLQASIYILPKPSFENEWKEVLNDKSISYREKLLPSFISNYKEKLEKYNYIAFVYSNEQLMAMAISESERMEVAREKWKEYKKYDYSCMRCNTFQLFTLEENGKWKYLGSFESKSPDYNQNQIIRNILSNISQKEQLNNLYYKESGHKKIEIFYYSDDGKLNIKNH